jgi:hypothetical protein
VLLLALGAYRQINPMPWSTPPWAFCLPLVAVCAAVALRRVAPRRSLALGTAALAADLLLGGSLGTILIYTEVVYDAMVFGPPTLWRHALRVSVVVVVASAIAGIVVVGSARGVVLGIPPVLVLILPLVTGISVTCLLPCPAKSRR